MDRARQLGALRQALASLDPSVAAGRHGVFSLGAGPVDATLGGGLARGAVHEIFPVHAADIAAAAGFAVGLALRAAPRAPVFWIRHRRSGAETGALHAHGLAEMGLAVDRLVAVHVDGIADGLRAGLEAMRCPGLGAVIFESWGASKHLDLTASRRFSLAAEGSGVTGVFLRAMTGPEPSAAATRWQVEAAPSSDPLGLVGRAALSARLLRRRSGPSDGRWTLEWNHETLGFALSPALSGAVSAPHYDRPAAAPGHPGWARAG